MGYAKQKPQPSGGYRRLAALENEIKFGRRRLKGLPVPHVKCKNPTCNRRPWFPASEKKSYCSGKCRQEHSYAKQEPQPSGGYRRLAALENEIKFGGRRLKGLPVPHVKCKNPTCNRRPWFPASEKKSYC